MLSTEAQQLAVAVRAIPDTENDYPPTIKQLQKLAIQMERALIEKKHRKAVLQALTGLPIDSMKQLGGRQISVLIDVSTEEAHHDHLFREIEIALEDAPVGQPWQLLTAVWEGAYLPVVREADCLAC